MFHVRNKPTYIFQKLFLFFSLAQNSDSPPSDFTKSKFWHNIANKKLVQAFLGCHSRTSLKAPAQQCQVVYYETKKK